MKAIGVFTRLTKMSTKCFQHLLRKRKRILFGNHVCWCPSCFSMIRKLLSITSFTFNWLNMNEKHTQTFSVLTDCYKYLWKIYTNNNHLHQFDFSSSHQSPSLALRYFFVKPQFYSCSHWRTKPMHINIIYFLLNHKK